MKIAELKKIIVNIPDDAEVVVNISGTDCRPAKMFAQMCVGPSGMDGTLSGWALVVDLDGEKYKIENNKLTYKMDESRRMPMRNPDGRFADREDNA